MRTFATLAVATAVLSLVACSTLQSPTVVNDLTMAIEVAHGLAAAAPVAAQALETAGLIPPGSTATVTGICAQAQTYLTDALNALAANNITGAQTALAQAQTLLKQATVQDVVKQSAAMTRAGQKPQP